MKIFDKYGVEHEFSDIMAAERLLELKRTSLGKEANGIWIVIEACIDLWSKRHPDKWSAYLVELDDVRKSRRDPKFAQSKEGGLRYTLDFPEPLMKMIRVLYNADELPMDREFFLRFSKKFPQFKVAQKL